MNRSIAIHSTGNGWDESTITYASAPSVGSSLGSVVQSGANQRHHIDVTRHVREAIAAGETEISVRMSQLGTATAQIASSENAVPEYRPALRSITAIEEKTVQFLAIEDGGGWIDNRNTAYPNAAELRVAEDDGDNEEAYAFFKFDVSELQGSVANATFDFTMTRRNSGSIRAHGVTTAWDDETLTFNNRPSTGSAVGSTLMLNVGDRHQINITSLLNQAIANGDDTVSLMLSSSTWRDSRVATLEHSNAAYRPSITVTGFLDNRAPVTSLDSYTTVEGIALRAGVGSPLGAPGVIANDADPDGNVLRAELGSQPATARSTWRVMGPSLTRQTRVLLA